MPRILLYQAAEATGSPTNRTICARRLILVTMLSLYLCRRNRRDPQDVGNLVEFPPFLAPALAAILAAEEIAVFRAGEHEIRIRLVRAECPEAGIRLHRKGGMLPMGTAIARSEEQRGRARRAVADAEEYLIAAQRPPQRDPRIIEAPGLPGIRSDPAFSAIRGSVHAGDDNHDDRL